MNGKDAAVYKVLAELDLYQPPGTADDLAEAFRIAKLTKEEHFLEDVRKLFQTPLQEMAFKTGITFPEYSQEKIKDILDYIKDAKEITKFEEGGRFALYEKENFYILRNGAGTITYGWANISKETFNGRPYNYLNVIYILPQFRKTGISLILFHAIKETVNGHILIDGPVFSTGEDFINSLAKKGIYTIWAINKETLERKRYQPDTITYDPAGDAIIIESIKEGLYMQITPGSDLKTYFGRFSEVVVD